MMLTGLLLMLVQGLGLGAVGLLLHRLSWRVGLLPVGFYCAALAATLQLFTPVAARVQITPDISLSVESTVLFPVALMLVIVVYIINGTTFARLFIGAVIGATLLAQSLVFFRGLYPLMDSGTILADASMAGFGMLLAGDLAVVVDLLLLAVLFQGMRNTLKQRLSLWLTAVLALAITLLIDTLIFQTLTTFNSPQFLPILLSQAVGKLLAALLLAPLLAVYLGRVLPRMPGYISVQERPTLELWFGNFQLLRSQLSSTQEMLRSAENYLDQLANNVAQAFLLSDVLGSVYYYVSPVAAGIFGRPAESFYKSPCTLFGCIYPDDLPHILDSYQQHYARGAFNETYRIVRPDNSVNYVRHRTFPVKDHTGSIYRIASIVEDVTEQRESDQQRFDLALEREKVTLLRNFINDASHDLRTPLTLINLKVDLLRRASDPERRERAMEELQSQVARMGKMIGDMLTLARLDDYTSLTYRRIDPNKVLRQVHEDLLPLAEQKDITLRLETAPRLPQVLVVENELGRALTNLVSNALNYTPPGGVVTLRSLTHKNGVLLEVQDTGVGIAPEIVPHLFDRFFHRDLNRVSGGEGIGLGLAIVKKIVDLHGGSIEVSSEVGSGTTFRLFLPLSVSRLTQNTVET